MHNSLQAWSQAEHGLAVLCLANVSGWKIKKRGTCADCGCIETLSYLWVEMDFRRVPRTEQHQVLVRSLSHPLGSSSEIHLVLWLPLHIFLGRANFI